jgi:diguanylate cyclase (GGDEF)-like protein
VLLGACYALWPNSAVAPLLVLVICLSACVALVVGPRINRCQRCRLRPWNLMALAGLNFMLGVLVRPWAESFGDARMLIADVVTLSGYALLIAALILMLRALGTLDRHAVLDGLIVAAGASAPAVQYLALPAALIADRPQVVSWVAALYPTVDVLVLFVIINLAFSTAVRLTSFRLILAAMVSMFVGDLGYAILGAQGQLTGPALLDLPFVLSFVAMGAAALHPSLNGFATIVPQPVQPWSVPRLALILPALGAPFVVLAATVGENTGHRVALALAGLMTTALLLRAVTAVRRLAETQAKWLYEATHDLLTDLPNRVLLTTRVGERLQGAPRGQTWVIYLDLDGFKLVNDHWGHGVGDRLLLEVAGRLLRATGDQCTVSRTSGDEFVVAGSGGAAVAVKQAQRIVELLREPVRVEGLELTTTASLGVVVHDDQPAAEDLLRDADLAMYRSKDAGRDRWTLFDVAMRDSVRNRVETELDLRRALQHDELWVAYQPLVRLGEGRVVGAEALVRWAHPRRGGVPPNEFIPVAEESGLIVELGTWVMTKALEQVADWRARGVVDDDFSVSVNVSARQLDDGALVAVVRDALAADDLPPTALVVELTESALMVDAVEAREVLHRLRALGVAVSVDDFGTGYSSLSYLGTLPVTGVKIDRSFVRDLGSSRQAEDIVRAIAAMSQSLDLEVTAEGVETAEQFAVVRDLGITKGQGWLWGKPVCAADFAAEHLTQCDGTAVRTA